MFSIIEYLYMDKSVHIETDKLNSLGNPSPYRLCTFLDFLFRFFFSYFTLLIPNYSLRRDSIKIWNVNCDFARKYLKYINS